MVRLVGGALLVAAAVGTSRAMELTKESWDSAVAGKTVFVKLQAPWCGHCKKMKPDWDKLSADFKDHASVLIGDVDCTADGKALCEQLGVQGYPTLKHGDPNDLQDYKGGRDLASLQKFAGELGPACSPSNIDLCDDTKKATIKEFMAMSSAERETMVKAKEEELAKLESDFKTFVDGLQKSYTEANTKKDTDVEAIKSSGLGLLKSVHAHVKKTGSSEL